VRIKSKSRRMFLQGSSGALLGIPFLVSVVPKQARAQQQVKKRFIALKSYSTQVIRDWYPARPTPGYQLRGPWSPANRDDATVALNQLIPGQRDHRWAPLVDFARGGQGISRIIDQKFNRYLNKMMLVRGLDFHMDTNHNGGGMLGNFASSEGEAYQDFRRPLNEQGNNRNRATIDQIMAYSNSFYTQGVPAGGARSIHLACRRYRGDLKDLMCFTTFGDPNRAPQPVTTILNPQEAFDQIFGGMMNNNNNQTPAPETDPGNRTQLMNLVFEDFQRVRNGRRISSSDKLLLDNYMDRLTDLITALSSSGPIQVGGECRVPNRPPSINNASNGTSVRESNQHMVNIIIAAILCGHTNIATLDIKSGFDSDTGIGSPHAGDVPGQWHGSAHRWSDNDNTAAMRQLLGINKWIADSLYYPIVEALDAVDDGNGQTVLDNSVVYWGNELGFNHLAYSVPALTAGSAGGFLNTGRYYDYIQWNRQAGKFSQDGGHTIPGVTHNRFLATLLQSMNISQAEYEAYNHGEAGYGSHHVTGNYVGGGHGAWDMSLNRSLLPGMRA
jgi:hypothetical protein